MAKFDPSLPLNPVTDRYQILLRWLCRGCLPSNKILTRSDREFHFCECPNVYSAILGVFLANVNSRSRSLYAIARPSVDCLSVTFVHGAPYSATLLSWLNFRQFFSPFGTLGIRWHPRKILPRSSKGNPSVGGGLNTRGVAKYSDFGAFGSHILETVRDRR